MTKPFPFSYSSLNSFENCALQHYHVRVARDIPRDAPSTQQSWGDTVHSALETGVKTGVPLPPPMKPYQAVVDQVCGVKDATASAEQQFCINASFAPVGWWDKDAWARGKVDVAVEKGVKMVALDYKTGKRRPGSTQLKLSAALIFHSKPHIEQITTGFVWLRDSTTEEEKFTRDDLPRIWTDFLPRIKRMELAFKEGKWTPTPSGLCGWCPVTRQHCPHSKKGLKAA